MALLLSHTFAFSCLLRGFWPLVRVLLIIKGEVDAMKTPIGCRDLRCDKDQFRAKMTVST